MEVVEAVVDVVGAVVGHGSLQFITVNDIASYYDKTCH